MPFLSFKGKQSFPSQARHLLTAAAVRTLIQNHNWPMAKCKSHFAMKLREWYGGNVIPCLWCYFFLSQVWHCRNGWSCGKVPWSKERWGLVHTTTSNAQHTAGISLSAWHAYDMACPQVASALEKLEELSKVERQWRCELFSKLKQANEPTGVPLPMVCPLLWQCTHFLLSSSGHCSKRVQESTCSLVAELERTFATAGAGV